MAENAAKNSKKFVKAYSKFSPFSTQALNLLRYFLDRLFKSLTFGTETENSFACLFKTLTFGQQRSQNTRKFVKAYSKFSPFTTQALNLLRYFLDSLFKSLTFRTETENSFACLFKTLTFGQQRSQNTRKFVKAYSKFSPFAPPVAN